MRLSRPLVPVVLVSLLVSGLLATAAPAQVPAQLTYQRLPEPGASKTRPEPAWDASTVLVKFKASTSKATQDATLERYGAQESGSTGATGYTVAELESGSPEAAVADLRRDPNVAHAQLNFIRSTSATPNDPALAFGDQEYLKKIRLLAAWDKTKGTTNRTIAIVDTGIDTNHPDLSTRIRPGFNAITGTTNVEDDNGHGTFVSGIAAAITNNNRGIAGAAWNAGILPVKVLGADGTGTDADVAEGITWAADHGASVINLSLGAPGPSQALLDAVNYAKSKNAVIVAAAGNQGWDVPSFPAAYDGVLAVTATDHSSLFAFFSNYGWYVDVAAPGVGIVSTVAGSTELYGIGSGTSFAAPLVSGVALLVRTQNPTWTQAAVHNRIRNTAQDFGPRGFDPFYGKGRLDAFAAVGGAVKAPAAQPTGDVFEFNPTLDRAKSISPSASANISPEGDTDWFFRDVGAAGSIGFTVTPPSFNPSAPRTREMDPVLEVYGPNLEPLGYVDSEVLGQPETVRVQVPAPGRYYARVRNFFGSKSPANYTITSNTSTNPFVAPQVEPVFSRSLPHPAAGVAIADVTGDARNDALVTNEFFPAGDGNTLYVFSQQTNGFLSSFPAQALALPSGGGELHAIDAADVNGDTVPDAVAAGDGGLSVFPNTGSGLAAGTGHATTTGSLISVEVADMDEDGDRDAVVAGGSAVEVVRNDGTGDFTAGTALSTTTPVFDVATGDLNGDAREDIIAVTQGSALVFRQQADHSFAAPTSTNLGLGGSRGVTTGDFNGDGLTDAAVSQVGRLSLLFQQAGGTIQHVPQALLYQGDIQGADLNGDGLVDLVVHGTETALLLQRSGGTFVADTTFDANNTGETPDGLAVGDLSSDGKPDLLLRANSGFAYVRQVGNLGPLFVRDHAPAEFSLNIGTGANATVEFARAMDASTLNATTVSILNAKTMLSIAVTRTYNATTRVLTLNPTAALLKNTPYIVSVTGGVKDAGGISMGSLYRFRFKTAA